MDPIGIQGLALSSDPASMAQAAKYYEQKGQPSKAEVVGVEVEVDDLDVVF